MAIGAQPLGPGGRAGVAAALAVPALIAVTAGAVLWQAEPGRGLSPADWSAVRFTLWQAAVSAVLSIGLAVPLARALARRRFRGRALLVTLLGAPFLLPTIVAVFGLVAVFGRSGALNAVLGWLGLPEVTIYGAHGVILAHVFYNLPLATRLILQGWAAIPAERFRLAATLGMDAAAVNRHLERPMLMRVVPGAALLVFVICTTSFAIALTLGGGPRATTVELAIYQALRFDFDLTRAAVLSLVQLAITGVAALLALRWVGETGIGAGLDRPVRRFDARGPGLRLLDGAVILLATLFLVLPMVAVALRGLPAFIDLPASVWTALLRSLAVAAASTALVVAGVLAISLAVVRLGRRGHVLEGAALLAVAASPLVIGTGLFIIVHPFVDPGRLALPVTALVNAVMTMPFALRAVIPATQAAEAEFGRLADSVGLAGWTRLRLLVLPRISRPLGFAAGLAAALSMGDLGVIALFADPETATLPLQVYRLMGAYRMDDAAAAALLLLVVTLALFRAFDRGGRGHVEV